MAILSGFDELDPTSNTFSDWVNKTNELILYVRGSTDSGQTSIMTANSLVGGSMTFGNATLFGQFSANAMVVFNDGTSPASNAISNGEFGGLRGGAWDNSTNTITTDTLYIVSNTTVTNETVKVNIESTYGLVVENTIDVNGDVMFVGTGSNTNPKLQWDSSADKLNFNDDTKLTFGDSDDFEIYHDGSNSVLREIGGGDFVIQANNIQIENTNGDAYFCGTAGSGASLHFNSAQKLITTNIGIDIEGEANTDTLRVQSTTDLEDDIRVQGSTNADTLTWDKSANTLNLDDYNYLTFGTGADFTIHHDGSNTYMTEVGAGELHVQANNVQIEDTDGDAYFCGTAGAGASLHFNGAQKLITTNIGVDIEGEANTDTLRVQSIAYLESDVNFDGTANDQLQWDASADELHFKDNVEALFGDSDDLTIKHDGTDSWIMNTTGELYVQGDGITLRSHTGTEEYLTADLNGAVTLYHNDVIKFATTAAGIDVTGQVLGDSMQIDGSVDLGASGSDTISMIGEIDTALIPATGTANVGSLVNPWDWGYFNDINVANTATILQLEVTTLEANGVAFTGTGGDVTTTGATVIDSFELGTTQGFKYFVHGEQTNDANTGYAVEINVIVTDNKDIYYTRYGEVENDMNDVTIVPALAANTTHVDLKATCLSASATAIHRFKVLKIETRAS